MPKMLTAGQSYAGRPDRVIPVNFSLDREAYDILQQLAPTTKAYGRFLSRLIFEHQARIEERSKLRKENKPADKM